MWVGVSKREARRLQPSGDGESQGALSRCDVITFVVGKSHFDVICIPHALLFKFKDQPLLQFSLEFLQGLI